jgi:hypothetical protein
MSIIAATNSSGALFEATHGRRTGLLRRALNAIIESRRSAAERRIGAYLDQLGDERLHAMGLSAAEIASVRARRWRGRLS